MIDWSRTADEIARQVRAFNPWPVAETRWQGQQLRIWEAEPRSEGPGAVPGTVVEAAGGRLAVAAGSGSLEIRRLQLAGRNATSAAEFLNCAQAARRAPRLMGAQPTPAEVRASAARLVSQVIDRGRSLDDLLAGDTDEGSARGLKRSLCYGTLRWHFRLVEVLRRLCERPLEQMAPELRALLEVGLFQLMSGEVAPHAAVAETVGATRVLGHDRASGFVNAVLRRFQREQQAVLADVDGDLAVRTAHPRWFVEMLRRDRPASFESILDAGNSAPADVAAREPDADRPGHLRGRARGGRAVRYPSCLCAGRAADRAAYRRALAARLRGRPGVRAGRRRPAGGGRAGTPAGRAPARCMCSARGQDLPPARTRRRPGRRDCAGRVGGAARPRPGEPRTAWVGGAGDGRRHCQTAGLVGRASL